MLGLLEQKLTFKPNAVDHGGLAGLKYTRFRFGHEFGLDLDGIFVDKGSKCVVLFVHGNKHNLTHFREHYELFQESGLSFMAFDYPGYGQSSGAPSEELLYTSARAAYSYITRERGYSDQRLAVYGCSLGGAVSIELLRYHQAACLVTESTFTCSWDMAQHLYPYLPIWRLFPNRFRNDEKIRSLTLPLFMIHGEDDRVVPCSMGRQLRSAAPAAERFVTVPGANHVNALQVGGASLRAEISTFIRRHTRDGTRG
jgi:pimeloyl-ACP methyl ester carboxylesterase